jgi:hypothetical protein
MLLLLLLSAPECQLPPMREACANRDGSFNLGRCTDDDDDDANRTRTCNIGDEDENDDDDDDDNIPDRA